MLKLTSIQAPNQDFIIAGLADYLCARLGLETEFVHQPSWQTRKQLLLQGEIQIGWVCGLPYVRHTAQLPAPFMLLAAPVMRASRYGQRPIYFSDVIVHRDSTFELFADLRGASWAFNEPGSHSGHNLTRYHLATIGESSAFFGSILAAGSHQNAIELVRQREIDASAIDSTVLEIEIQLRPEIQQDIRILASLGPSPIPPLVISKQIDPDLREQIQTALLEMHTDPEGQALLSAGLISHFVQVSDQDYDPIRRMARLASQVSFEPTG
jgi:phosphonate transport system substrate-binding protein